MQATLRGFVLVRPLYQLRRFSNHLDGLSRFGHSAQLPVYGVSGSWEGQARTSRRLWLVPTNAIQPVYGGIISLLADVDIDDNAVLRLRICGHAACVALFTIRVNCDRGQRYCSPECRSEVRRRQEIVPIYALISISIYLFAE